LALHACVSADAERAIARAEPGYDPALRTQTAPRSPAAEKLGSPMPAASPSSLGMPTAPRSVPPLSLDEHVRWALEHNPALGVFGQEYAASAELPRQVSSAPNPKLSVTHYAEPIQTRVGPQNLALGLTQALPWFGTLALRGEAAQSRAAAAGERLRGVQLETVRAVRRAWSELAYLARAEVVLEKNMALLELRAQSMRARFATGSASHGQLVRTDLERDRLEDRLAALRGRGAPARARLARALGTPLPRPTTTPADYGGLLDGHAYRGEGGESAVPTRHPELRSAQAVIEAARAQESLARKKRYPDFALGLRWIATGDDDGMGGLDAGQDALMATLMLDLPLDRGRVAAGERAARARGRSAALALERTRQDLAARLAAARFDFDDAGRRMELFEKSLVPRARAALAATEPAFTNGAASFTDLLDAYRVLLDLELSLEGARRDRALARADLDALLAPAMAPAMAKTQTTVPLSHSANQTSTAR
jgi:outer membrane protein TolC